MFLCVGMCGWVITCWSATTVYFSAGFDIGLALVFQRLIYTGNILGAMFLFLFASEIFFQVKKMWKTIYILGGVALIVALFEVEFSSVYLIEPAQNYNVLLLSEVFGGLMLIYLLPAFLGIFFTARRASKKMENPLYKAGYNYIANGQIFGLLTMAADIIGTIVIDDVITYTICLNLTWIFLIFTAWFYYIGWILPPGFRRRIEMQEEAKK